MTAVDLNVGDTVWHKVHRKLGRVESQPRAHSTMVRLKLEENTTASYYMIADLEVRRPEIASATPPPPGIAAAKVAAPVDPVPEALAPAPAKAIAPQPSPPPVEHRDNYAGELTLAKLLQLRNDVAATLYRIDAAIVKIQVQQAVKEACQTIRYEGDVGDRARVAAEAVQINRRGADALKEVT